MMFQVFFLRFIARKVPSNNKAKDNNSNSSDEDADKNNDNFSFDQSQSHILKVYNSSLGRPTAAMHSAMIEEYNAIMRVSNYEEFFARINLFYTPQQFTSMLRNAVRESVKKNYVTHINVGILGGLVLEPVISSKFPLTSANRGIGSTADEKHVAWVDVWKLYGKEKTNGDYNQMKIIETRGKVFNNRRKFPLQQQQQQHQQHRNNHDTLLKRNGYQSVGNKAANNYNYMQRNNYDNNISNNGKNGHQSLAHNQYKEVNNSSRDNSNNNSKNYSNNNSKNNNNGPSNNSHFQTSQNSHPESSISTSTSRINNPRSTPATLKSQEIRRAHGSRDSLSSLLHPASSTASTTSNNSNSNCNSNGNNYSNNNNIKNSSNNKNKGKFSHKNSTMNNAMSVSGDRVRLHVFYQVGHVEQLQIKF